jgi:DNA-3-methyladenine glycosylase II
MEGSYMWEENEMHLFKRVDDLNFSDILLYLNRNPKEVLHEVDLEKQCVTKAVSVYGKPIIILVSILDKRLCIEFPLGNVDAKTKNELGQYVDEWFDLNRDLQPFYDLTAQDEILRDVVASYKGLRIVGVEDLFEALCWAIMGQQISLHVAYSLKQKLVTTFGESITYQDKKYWLFPTTEKIGSISLEKLRELSFTQRKAEYVLGVAQLMTVGTLSHQQFEGLSLEQMEKDLTSIRGIGKWSANYVIMRCFRHPDAFPLADVGLHNALKQLLGRAEKPSIEEIENWSVKWKGWRAYATFYLWRTLQS